MRVLRIVGIALGLVLVALAGLFAAARFGDGPLGPIPGGAFSSGAWVAEPVDDWSFAADVPTIQLQLAGEDTSRTVWFLVRDGRAYVPCSLSFPPGKRWYRRADRDGRAVLRIQGRRYPVTLTRDTDSDLATDLGAIVDAKYGTVPPSEGGVWFFAVSSRPREPAEG